MEFLNNVIQGNCLELMPRLADNSVELTLTDIPYGVVNRESNGLRVLDKGVADIETFDLGKFLPEVVRITKGSVYVFCSTEQVSYIRSYLAEAGLTTRLCIWEKTNPSPMNGEYVWLSGIECCIYGKKRGGVFNEHCKNTVWRFPTVRRKQHPTEKSIALFEYLVNVSSNPGDIVFDPCVGSGTAAVAAKKLNRNYIAFDISEEFVMIARDRLNSIVMEQI